MATYATQYRAASGDSLVVYMANVAKENGEDVFYHCLDCGEVTEDIECKRKYLNLEEATGSGCLPPEHAFYMIDGEETSEALKIFGKKLFTPEMEGIYVVENQETLNKLKKLTESTVIPLENGCACCDNRALEGFVRYRKAGSSSLNNWFDRGYRKYQPIETH